MGLDPKKIVTIHFTIKDDKGIVQDSTKGQPPHSFLGSTGNMFQRVEEKLSTMKVGESATLTLEPGDAYGEYDKECVRVTGRDNFPESAELKEGMTFLTQVDGQEVPVIIKKIDEKGVSIDFNHPLAGQKLEMEIELLELRDATEEELSGGHVHGEGCKH